MVVHDGAGAGWDAQSWMICMMDMADTAPIKAAPSRRSARWRVPDCLPLSSLCVARQVCGTADYLKQLMRS
jgi:hypothetical protein